MSRTPMAERAPGVRNGRRVDSAAQVKKGLARALTKFDAYQLAKYDRDGAVRIKDVLFLV